MLKTNSEGRTFRILYCSEALTFGGEQKLLAQMCRHIDQSRFQTVICCVGQFGHVDESIRALEMPMLSLGVKNRYNLPRVVWKLRRVIREYSIDLVVTGIFGSEFSGLLAAVSMGIPMVAILETTYDLATRDQASAGINFTKWRFLYALHALIARMPRIHYVALSQAVKQSAVKHLHLPPERVTVIPLCSAPDEFDNDLLNSEAAVKVRSELGINGAYPVLLNVARLSSLKGQKDLLQVMPRVLECFPEAMLLIAGDGPLFHQLAELRDNLGLRERVLLLNHRDDICTLLHASDLFLFSSYFEGLPVAVIEAMTAGKCVIAFDIPALRGLVRDGYSGVLVEGRNIRQLAETIIDLAEHSDTARKMGERARRIVRKEFDIRRNVKELETLYNRMLMGYSVAK